MYNQDIEQEVVITIYENDIWLEQNKCTHCHKELYEHRNGRDNNCPLQVESYIRIIPKDFLIGIIRDYNYCMDCGEFFIFTKLKERKQCEWIGFKERLETESEVMRR